MILALKRISKKRGGTEQGTKSKFGLWILGFVFITLVSFIYHLPASWVLQQAEQQQLIPKGMKLTQVKGTLWQGQAQLSLVEKAQTNALGQFHWQLSGWALLSLQADIDFKLNTANGGARGNLHTGLMNQEDIRVSKLEGLLPVNDLKPILPKNVRSLGELKGQLTLNNLQLSWNQPTQWLISAEGSVELTELDVMGVVIPKIAISPTIKENKLHLDTVGGGQGWSLTGQALVSTKEYQTDFKLKADNPDSMPDWTELIMRKNSAVLATYKQKGRM
ncbi:MAG: type II secretion system protein N [Pseudomonadota bacterium]|nr:type II secretion system protein N [Pseudomonadota bacterium]